MKIVSKIIFSLLVFTKICGITREEAYEYMGLSDSASKKTVDKRYKELALKMHPDKAFLQNHPTAPYLSSTKINFAIEQNDYNFLKKAILTIAVLINYQPQQTSDPKKIIEYCGQLLKIMSGYEKKDNPILEKQITIFIKFFFKNMFNFIITGLNGAENKEEYIIFMKTLKNDLNNYNLKEKKIKQKNAFLSEASWQNHPAFSYINRTDKELNEAIEQNDYNFLKKTILAIAVLIDFQPQAPVSEEITQYRRQLLKIASGYKKRDNPTLEEQIRIITKVFFENMFDIITKKSKSKEEYNNFMNTLKKEAEIYDAKKEEIEVKAQIDFKKLTDCYKLLIKEEIIFENEDNDDIEMTTGKDDNSGTSLVKTGSGETQLYIDPEKILKKFNLNNINWEKSNIRRSGVSVNGYLPQGMKKEESLQEQFFINECN